METLQRSSAVLSWDQKILEHLPALHRYALGLARNFHAAEDLVHDTVVNGLTPHLPRRPRLRP
jgi:DNA-directed RNA polymerase specialized sigma24 family protein